MVILVGIACGLFGGVAAATVAAIAARHRALYAGLPDQVALAHERERDPDSDEAAALLEMQVAHGIVRCLPSCTVPGHAVARAQDKIARECRGRTERGR